MSIRHDTTAPRGALWDNDHVGDLDDLDDVNAPSPSDLDVLTWDSTPGEWVPMAIPAGAPIDLDDLTDVTITAPATGAVLKYDGGGWIDARATPDMVDMPVVGSPDYTTLEHWFNQFGSTGTLNDVYYVTNKDSDEVTVAAGQGLIRTTNSTDGVLKFIEWPAIDLTVPTTADSVRFIGVEYNAGTPQAVVRTSFDWNWNTDFPLAKVFHDGTNRHIFNSDAHAEDTANKTRRFLREILPLARAATPEGGGLALGVTGTRNVTLTAGKLWHGFNEFDIDAIDTSGADTFRYHVRASTGPTTWDAPVLGNTQWPNTQYDDGTNLVTMVNTRYANLWWYVDAEDGDLVLLFGRAQYVTSNGAQAETPPNTVPGNLTDHARLLGRFIFQKNDAVPVLIQSTNDVVFTNTGITSHSDLSNLSADDHTQYIKDSEFTAAGDFLIGTGAGTFEARALVDADIPNGLFVDASVSGATNIDHDDGPTQDLTLTGDATFTMTNAVVGEATDWRLVVRQDGVGGWVVTWADTFTWVGGSEPVLQTAPSAVDVIGVLTIDDGATFFGFHVSGATVAALDDLTDVNAPAPNDLDVLTWDDGAGEWIAAAPTGSVTLADLAALGLVGTIVMSEGIEDPPEPMWTEDGTDYIYAEVGQ